MYVILKNSLTWTLGPVFCANVLSKGEVRAIAQHLCWKADSQGLPKHVDAPGVSSFRDFRDGEGIGSC